MVDVSNTVAVTVHNLPSTWPASQQLDQSRDSLREEYLPYFRTIKSETEMKNK